jgi:hypothetical protein
MKKNKNYQPFLLISSTILILISFSFFKLPIVPYLNHLESIDILSEVRKSSPIKNDFKIIQIVYDSSYISKLPNDQNLILDYGLDSTYSLRNFFNKLDKNYLSKNKIRIAYFGDSFIEGDYITDELRKLLQQEYNGHGIGFLPIQSVVSDNYRFINFKSINNWIDYNFMDKSNKYQVGLGGHVFYSNGLSKVEYRSKNGDKFSQIKIYTGKISMPSILNIEKDDKKETLTINKDQLVNEISINENYPIRKITISTPNNDLPIYGLNIDDTSGIYIDNYGFRGNTGALNLKISKEILKQFNSYLHYDLIILHYGINAMEHDQEKFGWFENSMAKFIQNVRYSIPNTPILLISTSDVGYKINGKYSTEHAVPFMVETQNKIALKQKVAFWNLFNSMGGKNTIVNWVEGDSTLAYKDYTHLNATGAKKVAYLFFTKLLASKSYYLKPSKKDKI